MLSLSEIQAAKRRIKSGIYYSPCPRSEPLSDILGLDIFCKLDHLQRTGSFKERGARNALLLLSEEERRFGVVAASAGNHALGLAYHGKLLDVPVTVVMPEHAPLIKITTCQRLGARVVVEGNSFAEARSRADQLAQENRLTYIHGYDDWDIIAGQGTMGLEILDQVPDLEAILVPIGGGGLVAGIGLAVKSLKPAVKVIGVAAENTPSFAAAMAAGKPVLVENAATLADGLAVPAVGANAFVIAREVVDRFISVTENEIALAILRILELEKSVVEGAAASTLAALLSDKLPDLRGKRVALPFCGGNIDPGVLNRVIERGLVADGRLFRFIAIISDRPGGLAALTQVIASTGASVKEINHDRTFCQAPVSAVQVSCIVETRDQAHIDTLRKALDSAGVRCL
ncbi:MAG: threonine ammonia-lyase [Verrucomicrobia bacterium]|nr:threonine ammonia-lyase [Verrucomicrobiota bacterium]MBV9275949.1 threonine ammonia-lyase [Verrucomicrobiota bacterium]